jgi:hypothetical protein
VQFSKKKETYGLMDSKLLVADFMYGYNKVVSDMTEKI